MLKKSALHSKPKYRRELEQASVFDHRLAINDNPRVTKNLPICSAEPNKERRSSTPARQHAIEKETTLKTITVEQARQPAQSQYARD